jgi:hypothetical protein
MESTVATVVSAESHLEGSSDTDPPQPYGEIFVMRADGSDVEQITDNQWEEGTPAWQPARKSASTNR